MKELYTKIESLKTTIEKIEDEKYREIFQQFNEIIYKLTEQVEENIEKQEIIEENLGYMGKDLTDIQEELFEEVTFEELSDIEDEYVEINCQNCSKPLFIEQQSIENKIHIPCPFCGERAK